jgi:hypothetical protein
LRDQIGDGCYWQILLQKSFWADQRDFLGPLMGFARGDVRDDIVLAKIDHGLRIRAKDRSRAVR